MCMQLEFGATRFSLPSSARVGSIRVYPSYAQLVFFPQLRTEMSSVVNSISGRQAFGSAGLCFQRLLQFQGNLARKHVYN